MAKAKKAPTRGKTASLGARKTAIPFRDVVQKLLETPPDHVKASAKKKAT